MMMSFAATSVVGLVVLPLLLGILTTTTPSSISSSSILVVTVEAFHTDRVTTSLLPSSQSLLLDRRGGGGGGRRRRRTQELRPARSSSFVPSSSSSVGVLLSTTTTNTNGSDTNKEEDPEAVIFNILGDGRISLSVRRSTYKVCTIYCTSVYCQYSRLFSKQKPYLFSPPTNGFASYIPILVPPRLQNDEEQQLTTALAMLTKQQQEQQQNESDEEKEEEDEAALIGEWKLLYTTKSTFDRTNPLGKREDGTTPGLEQLFPIVFRGGSNSRDGDDGDGSSSTSSSSSPIQRLVTNIESIDIYQNIRAANAKTKTARRMERVDQLVKNRIGDTVLRLSAAASYDAERKRINFAFDLAYFMVLGV